jgi:hypothetical protein
METKAQRLPEKLSKNGNKYQLYKPGERAMIYAVFDCDGNELDYEVFQIRIRPAGQRFCKNYPVTEIFPHSEAFGSWAFWCPRLEKALDYFDQMERGEKPGRGGAKEVSH